MKMRDAARWRSSRRGRRPPREMQVLAEPTAAVEARRRERVRPGRLGRRRHEHDLLDAEHRPAPRSAASRPPGRSHSAVRFAAPVAVGAKRDRRAQSVASGIVSAAATASAQVIARRRRRGRTLRRGAPSAASPVGAANQIAAAAFADQREHQVAVRVDVVHRDDQLAESRLPEVLGEQLGVAPRRARRRRLLQLRGAAHQIPHHRQQRSTAASRRQRRAAPRATSTRPRAPAPAPPSSRRRARSPPPPPSTSTASRGSQVGSARGANAASANRR